MPSISKEELEQRDVTLYYHIQLWRIGTNTTWQHQEAWTTQWEAEEAIEVLREANKGRYRFRLVQVMCVLLSEDVEPELHDA